MSINYYAVDGIGREWIIPRSSVKENYIQFLMQEDNLSREIAEKKSEENNMITHWWYEQIVIYPDIVMKIGTMTFDISQKEKDMLLENLAARYMNAV